MGYTNGYDSDVVLPALKGRLGWSDASLNADNKTSRSGRRFDDGSFHALVTVENIKSTKPREATDLDAYLSGRQTAAIARALNGVFNDSQFKQQTMIYRVCDGNEILLPNQGRFSGYEIRTAEDLNYSTRINSVDLQFDGTATFNLYLFRQGSNVPIKSKSVTTQADEIVTVDLSSEDWIINRRKASTFYIGYFQNDLDSVKAIRPDADMLRTYMVGITGCEAKATGSTTFDRKHVSYSCQPMGFNMLISSFQDITQAILNQPHLFDELLGLTMAYMTIEQALNSLRSNQDERVIKDQAHQLATLMDLNGAAPISDSPQIMGIKQRIAKEAARVKNEFFPKHKIITADVHCQC